MLSFEMPEDILLITKWPKCLAKQVMLKLAGWIWRPAIKELVRRTECTNAQMQQIWEHVSSLEIERKQLEERISLADNKIEKTEKCWGVSARVDVAAREAKTVGDTWIQSMTALQALANV